MPIYVLIHGAGDGGWNWQCWRRSCATGATTSSAPDLPSDDDSAGLPEYAGTVVDAIGDRTDLVVVAHSFGGFTAPLVGR
jgi:pimeloyl-ACP methyl ester carboxylesterase